jgi:hypothetical protein
MVNPSGYTALDLVGFTDRGPYDPNYNYVANDLAHHAGSIWCCLIDDTMGIEPTDGVNWRFWVKDSQEGISDIVNILGAKNLLDVTPRLKANQSARNYLSYDGQTIIVNGTVSTAEYTRLNGVDGAFKLPQGSYIFSGKASNSNIRIILRKNGTEIAYGQTPNVTFESDGNTDDFTFLVYVKAGTYTNETVKAMIRPSGIEDDTWQPYTKTNKELTAEVAQNTSNIQALTNNVAKCETLVVSVPSFSALPQTITNANIDDDMVVVNSVLSNPSAQTGDWTVNTSNGSLTISGSISGTTTATLYLMKSR